MKQAIRQKICEKRKALSPDLYAEKSALIREKLESLPEFQDAEKVLVYISTPEEVATHELTKSCIESNKKVYVPKVLNEGLAICPILSWNELKPGAFGILEPCEIPSPTNPEEIDLILVPGIAFDPKGHRIGYGKGFYDSLLKSTRGIKIGLAFHEQIIDEVPAESHDVPLDLIITDSLILTP